MIFFAFRQNFRCAAPTLKTHSTRSEKWQNGLRSRTQASGQDHRNLAKLELLADLIPERVGSLLSLNALREDLEVSHRAVTHWIEILERFYFLFRVPPFYSKKIRSLKKEAKVYLWDWSLVSDPGARLENLVACHLLKFCHTLADLEGYRAELYYLRDLEKREVDFLVTLNRKPWFAVEVKTSETEPAKTLEYFGSRIEIPYLYQLVLNTERHFRVKNIEVLPLHKFLAALP